MDGLSNKISPLFQKIFSSPLVERVLGREETPDSSILGAQLSTYQNDLLSVEKTEDSPGHVGGICKTYSRSRYLHGRQLGRLDPALYLNEESEDLYDFAPGHCGRVWFTVSYCKANELLKVTVHKIRNLRSTCTAGGASLSVFTPEQLCTLQEDCALQDVRVKLFVEQAEKKYHTTSLKKQATNPNFNEHFCFQVASHRLAQQTLHLDVLGYDKRRRCRLIGFVTFGLAQFENNPTSNNEVRVFRDIQLDTHQDDSANPQLLVALTYFPVAERLIVGLFTCRNLPLRDNGLPVDVCAKTVVYQGLQGKELKSKRSEWLGTRETFDESFVFSKIPDPTNVNVRITLIQHGFIDKQLGFVVLGGEMVSKGRGVTHWQAMIENPEEQVCEWQELQLV